MKKYKLDIRIRKGMEERLLEEIELDLVDFQEAFPIRNLEVFNRDAYLTFSLSEIEEKTED